MESNNVPPETLRKVFQANVRERRKALGLTQVQLAERMQVHQPYVAELENGGRAPGLDTLAKVAEALYTTPDALLMPRGEILEKMSA